MAGREEDEQEGCGSLNYVADQSCTTTGLDGSATECGKTSRLCLECSTAAAASTQPTTSTL